MSKSKKSPEPVVEEFVPLVVEPVAPSVVYKNVCPHKLMRKDEKFSNQIKPGEPFGEDEVKPEFLAFWLQTGAAVKIGG